MITARNPQNALLPSPVFLMQSCPINNNINSLAIDGPWKYVKALFFWFSLSAMGSGETGVLKLQGRLRGTSTWQDVLGRSGIVVKFPDAKVSDGGQGDGAFVMGTIPLDRIDAELYDQLRWNFARNNAGTATVISGVAVGYQAHNEPVGSAVLDDLFAQFVNLT